MGVFSKKTDLGLQAFENYASAMQPWMTRVQRAREAGTTITTMNDALDAAGDVPALSTHNLSGSYERDRASYSAHAWISREADRLSRQDLIRGADGPFWQDLADELWAASERGIKRQPREQVPTPDLPVQVAPNPGGIEAPPPEAIDGEHLEGWYRDPLAGEKYRMRYWDGAAWTDRIT
jgi:hypothetical protein